MLPTCSQSLPPEIGKLIEALGAQWAASQMCPDIPARHLSKWDKLLKDWSEDANLPLLVRKGSSVRGSEITHSSGRKIIPCDNSPAQWAYSLAYSGKVPTIQEIRNGFQTDRIPISFAHKKSEKEFRRYHCTLGKFSVNKKKWKLCHTESVGLKTKQALSEVDIDILKKKFILLLAPDNHFLLPLGWGGLGEAKEFIDGFKKSKK